MSHFTSLKGLSRTTVPSYFPRERRVWILQIPSTFAALRCDSVHQEKVKGNTSVILHSPMVQTVPSLLRRQEFHL